MKTKLFRTSLFDIKTRKPEGGDCYDISFSSEEPVERGFGLEILDHSAGCMDMTRLNNAAPLLWQHNADEQIGVVENAAILDKRGVAQIRFGNSARAKEVKADVDAGIIRNVSVGYLINNTVNEKNAEGRNVVRATGWMPLELSFVSIPADQTVGVGRSEETPAAVEPVEVEPVQEEPPKQAEETRKMDTPTVDINEVGTKAMNEERRRVSEINAIAAKHPETRELADKAISEGMPLADFQRAVIAAMPAQRNEIKANIGMSEKEVRKYDFGALVRALIANKRGLAPFEFECSDAVAKANKSEARGAFVPYDVQVAKAFRQTRSVYDGSTHGAEFIQTDVLTSNFIEALRNRLVCVNLGARFLTGLIGDVSIPKANAVTTASWVADGSSGGDKSPTYKSLSLTPKNVTARIDIYRNLLQQTNGLIQDIVMSDLTMAIATAIDAAAIAGTGASNQPKGILNSSLCNAKYFGTTSTDSTAGLPTWAKIIAAETEVGADNGNLANCVYAFNAKTIGKLKQVLTSSLVGARYLIENGTCNGYPVFFSNQLPYSSTKAGSSLASDGIFGDFSQVIIGIWGNGLDLMVDPYSLSTSGQLRIVAFQTADVGLRHEESFCKMLNITTS